MNWLSISLRRAAKDGLWRPSTHKSSSEVLAADRQKKVPAQGEVPAKKEYVLGVGIEKFVNTAGSTVVVGYLVNSHGCVVLVGKTVHTILVLAQICHPVR